MTKAYMQYDVDSDGILTATMDDADGRVNVMNGAFIDALKALTQKLSEERDLYKGVILTSAKSTFFAGGDLQEILAITDETRDVYFEKVQLIKKHLRALETQDLPVVAAINGAALGGGYEICLSCHHRIAAKNPKTIIGVPEVTLGLLPGGGGVIRLTRLLGTKAALPILITGKAFSPEESLANGMIDEIAEDNDDMFAKAKAWILSNPSSVQPWDKPDQSASEDTLSDIQKEFETRIEAGEFTSGPAPATILKCALESKPLDFATAMALESQYLTDLAVSPSAKEHISAFFEKTRKKK